LFTQIGTGHRATMPYGWEGNRRSGVALAMRHGLQWFIHLPTGSMAFVRDMISPLLYLTYTYTRFVKDIFRLIIYFCMNLEQFQVSAVLKRVECT